MGIYKTQYETLPGYVKAYNQASADAEMKWVYENIKCFCESCRDLLAKQHLVVFDSLPFEYYSPIHKEE